MTLFVLDLVANQAVFAQQLAIKVVEGFRDDESFFCPLNLVSCGPQIVADGGGQEFGRRLNRLKLPHEQVMAGMQASGHVTHSSDVAEVLWRAATDPACPMRLPAGADAVAAAGAAS